METPGSCARRTTVVGEGWVSMDKGTSSGESYYSITSSNRQAHYLITSGWVLQELVASLLVFALFALN
jgi:hypothetical protein